MFTNYMTGENSPQGLHPQLIPRGLRKEEKKEKKIFKAIDRRRDQRKRAREWSRSEKACYGRALMKTVIHGIPV